MQANKPLCVICGIAVLLGAGAKALAGEPFSNMAVPITKHSLHSLRLLASRRQVIDSEAGEVDGAREARARAFAEADSQRAVKAKLKARMWNDRDRDRIMRDAQRLLEQSMRQARDLNVTAIVTKVGECMQKVKIEQNAQGMQLSTVLQPLSMQGTTLFNSGSKSFTYWPDQRIVVECDSDEEDADDIERRAELAAQNYELRVEAAAAEIAGRPTICVTADPKVAGLPARQFYLDLKTLYPLRMTQQTDAGWKVNMDTVVVDFPKEMPDINLNLVGTPRKVKFDPAMPLQNIRNPRGRLGFDPIVPDNLPLGFHVQRAELRRNEDGQLVMLWLTDGLATARVYEFRCNQLPEGIWSRGANTVLTEDGVTMMLVSDLRADTRRALLRGFAKRNPEQIAPPANRSMAFPRSGTVPVSEPPQPKPMFNLPEPPNGGDKDKPGVPSPEANAIGEANNVKGE